MASGEPYLSRSAFELLTAIDARRNGKAVPDIYVFRKIAPVFVGDEDRMRQREDLDAFFRRTFYMSEGLPVHAYSLFRMSSRR
jgi:hypothetical protein